MSYGSVIALIQKFSTQTTPSAFPNLGIPRSVFAHNLMERINSPSLIDQGNSSLCGPASFVYSLLRRSPERYARYVMELYDNGRATLGHLVVAPGPDCRRYLPQPGGIDPVDWVALASLRDNTNTFLDYDTADVQVGGITMPGDLRRWFKGAQWSDVDKQTNVFFDGDLFTLVKAHEKYCAGYDVCLLIGANLLTRRSGGTVIPDHWVVLTSQIRIGGVSATTLLERGKKINGDKQLLDAEVEFEVYTWGHPSYSVTTGRAMLTVKTFLDFFYGFVAAK
jgi:hypothetical protein